MKLLIVEDNARLRRLIKSVLRDLSDEVIECSDGALALAAYAEHRPDFVLMNVRMKRMDGLTATIEIKAAFPEARIIVLTNYDDVRLQQAAKEAGAYAFFSKENLLGVRLALAD